ncbi:UDP-N-acetylglucosamine 2-epimerase (non-hydrolyzing) [Chryseolinea sp. H1M3-3]|uniref:non-hydrolyzing UDP-N-acetylglucosamine 2-epimerase n=1 Tax=Chryseolinea sp. H1M3-3 TaxID=3034144 RepID=UPI0023ED5A8D|nr:UDP-N-acetylglucosamine 2-epimerase (non-hydrolyzing) [Chryseolinea sp. H1M3-3]
MLITIVAGARPNFMKIGPIINAIKFQQERDRYINYRLVHTGQHYDQKMSGNFFHDLRIPEPDINLGGGGGTQAEQTAAIMVKFEKDLFENRSDVVLVVGDVTSTMACTIAAKKLCIPVAHVEAGIRSGDMTMPEEINRVVTDSICDHFFTTSEVANEHLLKSGVPDNRIHLVGNTMIDTLYQNLHRIRPPRLWSQIKLSSSNYFLLTLHRPSNVDHPQDLKKMLDVLLSNTNLPVVFPVHPRTKIRLDELGYRNDRLIVADPMGYLEFIFLVKNAKAVITDSGGITEEATVLNVPCLTLRNSTERPETITIGTNELVGTNPSNLIPFLEKLRTGKWKKSSIPPLWDGKTSPRIVSKLMTIYQNETIEAYSGFSMPSS